jgi:uncharacterized protein
MYERTSDGMRLPLRVRRDYILPPHHSWSKLRAAAVFCALLSIGIPLHAAETRIRDIQGATHVSPLLGQRVTQVQGIVTAKRAQGFYLQDPQPDTDDATSEAIYVHTPARVKVGDALEVEGLVIEFRPGGSAGSANLSVTTLRAEAMTHIAIDQPLPAPVLIGAGGRVPPQNAVKAAHTGNVERSKDFDPRGQALDFYESLEGMRVKLFDVAVIAPNGLKSALAALPGGTESVPNARGVLLRAAEDVNPERILIEPAFVSLPAVKVGDRLPEVIGVFDYGFGHYRLLATDVSSPRDGNLKAETARVSLSGELSIACYNVENLDGRDPQPRFDRIAAHIVHHLHSPDLIGLIEVQDSNGPVNDGTVDAAQTMTRLVEAVRAAGGPEYVWRGIDPQNNEDGGERGGNIRPVFLYKPQVLQLASLQRLGVGDAGFLHSRKPLAGEFSYGGRNLHVVLNHFASKRRDDPLFGLNQPPRRLSEPQRHRQARVVADFVLSLKAPDALAVVMGDLNDFEYSETLWILEQAGLYNMHSTLPAHERYSFIHEGNAQALDHILVTPALARVAEYDIVHVNVEFPAEQRGSDHDPPLLRLRLH